MQAIQEKLAGAPGRVFFFLCEGQDALEWVCPERRTLESVAVLAASGELSLALENLV